MCSGQLSLLASVGGEMSSILLAVGWRPSVADWGAGMSAVFFGCSVGLTIFWCRQWMAA